MKCKKCGSNLTIEDEKCPYCWSMNPYYKKHRADMQRYHMDFQKTKTDVEEKTTKITVFSVRVVFVSILLVMIVFMLFAYGNAWSIARGINNLKIKGDFARHAQAMEQYEAEGRYFELTSYYNEQMLYNNETFRREYSNFASIASSYMSLYYDVMRIASMEVTEEEYWTLEEAVEWLTMDLDTIFQYCDEEYSYGRESYEKHKEAIDDIGEKTLLLLKTYCNVSEEDLLLIPEASSTKRIIILERSLIGNEE